ncbi:MAG: DUF3788 family protein [Flavobacteriales bacterium]|nr:DUF3788 family protein [Flavobacteriales bacterium]
MPTSPFPDPDKPPTDEELAAVIGKDFRIVAAAMEQLRSDHKSITHTYKFSKISGWHVTYDKGRHRLFYLFPRHDDFLLKVVFNDEGIALLAKAEAWTAVKEKLRSAKKYAEGTLLEFAVAEITSRLLAELLRIKVASMS